MEVSGEIYVLSASLPVEKSTLSMDRRLDVSQRLEAVVNRGNPSPAMNRTPIF
jgi:hypothetical protein